MSLKSIMFQVAAMSAIASQGIDMPVYSSHEERRSTLTRKEQKRRQKKNKSASKSRAKNRRK